MCVYKTRLNTPAIVDLVQLLVIMYMNVYLKKISYIYIKEDVVWMPTRQLSTRDQNDTEIINYRLPYGLQQ